MANGQFENFSYYTQPGADQNGNLSANMWQPGNMQFTQNPNSNSGETSQYENNGSLNFSNPFTNIMQDMESMYSSIQSEFSQFMNGFEGMFSGNSGAGGDTTNQGAGGDTQTQGGPATGAGGDCQTQGGPATGAGGDCQTQGGPTTGAGGDSQTQVGTTTGTGGDAGTSSSGSTSGTTDSSGGSTSTTPTDTSPTATGNNLQDVRYQWTDENDQLVAQGQQFVDTHPNFKAADTRLHQSNNLVDTAETELQSGDGDYKGIINQLVAAQDNLKLARARTVDGFSANSISVGPGDNPTNDESAGRLNIADSSNGIADAVRALQGSNPQAAIADLERADAEQRVGENQVMQGEAENLSSFDTSNIASYST